MDGEHTIERCEEVTGRVQHAVFAALYDQRVSLEGMLLKPNMVISGEDCATQASVGEVAAATLRMLRRHVPPAVPGVVFLSGGQDDIPATEHLAAINQLEGPKPWKLSYSYGRALQDAAMAAWQGRSENVAAAQHAFFSVAPSATAPPCSARISPPWRSGWRAQPRSPDRRVRRPLCGQETEGGMPWDNPS
jgi:fructose-bisphosphate aldolase class I